MNAFKLKRDILMKIPALCLFMIFSMTVLLAQSKLPVTNHPFNDDRGKLQFAIISDLWGGNRPGIFEDAVEKLELLATAIRDVGW